MEFPGSPDRRLDTLIWFPTASRSSEITPNAKIARGGPWPLLIFSHGYSGMPSNAVALARELVGRGYVVAAPAYPLTSRESFAKIKQFDHTDTANQVVDIRFLIDSLLADPFLRSAIDPDRIAIAGHSLGAQTSYFAVYGQTIRDPRIKAVVMMAPGDPVQSALTSGLGFGGVPHAEVSVPALFLMGDQDIVTRTFTGGQYAPYYRIDGPKYAVMIKGGTHGWFLAGIGPATPDVDLTNPDCRGFAPSRSPTAEIANKMVAAARQKAGGVVPGCEEQVPLIGAARQLEITMNAVRDFLDGYLKADAAALSALRQIDRKYSGDVELRYEDK